MSPRRSHLIPRTRDGWICCVLFLVCMALAQPPIVHGLMNRIEPWVLGMPFLYAYLLVIYVLMIVVLIWGMRRGI